jgi:hypothetical protein
MRLLLSDTRLSKILLIQCIVFLSNAYYIYFFAKIHFFRLHLIFPVPLKVFSGAAFGFFGAKSYFEMLWKHLRCRHCNERSEETIRKTDLFYALFFRIASPCACQ